MPRRRIEPGPIGPDVDLDTEEFYAADGRRLTNELADEIAGRALERLRGRRRPSLMEKPADTSSATPDEPSA
jgi:hypothetical protein